MLKEDVRYWVLIIVVCYGMVLASCHSPANKESVKIVPGRDTAKAIVHTELLKKASKSYLILDTVVGRDTIKFVLYNDSLARCSINNLSDTFNSGGWFEHWDSSFGDYGLMIVPGKKKLQKFILNDSLVIIPVSYGYMRMSGGVALYLINRTKKSLKFARINRDNPFNTGSECPYVDIKSNQIINYYYHEILNDQDAGNDGEEHGRYKVYRCRIKNKQFVQTDEVASSSKEIEKIELFDPGDSDLRAFYTMLAHHEDWERDRYDSSNIQRIVAIDTTVGKDKIKVWYDSYGNIVCTLNDKCDSTSWDETWIGYEWWRKKAASRIIVQGEKKSRALILNDSLLLFTLVNSDRKAVLFVFDRKRTNLDSNIINTFANYVYVDLKRNTVLSYVDTDYRVDLRDDVGQYPRDNDSLYLINGYRIYKDVFSDVKIYRCIFKGEYPVAPASFEDSRNFYNSVVQSFKSGHYVSPLK